MSTILYVFLALLLLGIMITVHELGHFFAARACGIAVRAFGIGFGPRVAHWVSKKSGTEYSIRLIPAGGFCGFFGEDDAAEKDKDDPRSMLLQPAWKRLITIAAGPIMNLVLAFVVALAFFAGYGVPFAGDNITTAIMSVEEGSPAQEAGLQAGDIVTAVNGETVNGDLGEKISAYQAGDDALVLTVLRGEEEKTLLMTPHFVESENRYMIGITMVQTSDTVWRRVSLGDTISHTWYICTSAGTAILDALKNLVTTGEGLNEMAGPVGAINLIADQTRQYKLMGYLNMLIMISINLGLINLLPIPGLDGSRIVFVLIEMIFRKPVNRKAEAYIHLAGYILLLGVMVLFTFHDVINIFR